MVRVEFTTGNAAFKNDERVMIAIILRALADRIYSGHYTSKVYDENGNIIGSFTWERETPLY